MDVLRVMQPEVALKLFDKCTWLSLGSISYFYSQLLAWQKETAANSTVSPLIAPSSSAISDSSDVSSILPGNEINIQAVVASAQPSFMLANVLNCTGHAGQYILQFYDTHKKLTEQVRRDMTDIIVRYAHDNNISFSPTSTLSIIKQIIKTFPTETEVI